jgi:peroxiredoxin
MRPELERRGFEIVALSKDDVASASRHRQRDQLGFTLLADPGLDVIRAYGLVHHKAVEFSKLPVTFFGIPLGMYTGRRTMAIPTTLLVDEDGIVRWIDQADDYRLRGDAQRILDAIDAAFGRVGSDGVTPATRPRADVRPQR